jgi:hypothetical protein
MNYRKIAVVFFLIALAFPTFANRKAKVITESGKKRDVLFLKMASDTLYLKAFKPNGDMFSISGHKSKFREVKFSDGSLLDFSLSEFPPVENPRQSSEGSWKDTFPLTNQFDEEKSPEAATLPPQAPLGILPVKEDHPISALDTLAHWQKNEKSPEKSTIDSGTAEKKHIVPAPEKPQPLQPAEPAPMVVGKKKARGFVLSLCLLSGASFAGSGVMYYFYRKDHWKEEETFSSLNNLSVKGSNSNELISNNKAQHQEERTKLNFSQILLGIGAASLVTGVVFYF